MKRALRRCALILADAAVACIETLSGPLLEAEVREKRLRRQARKRQRDYERAQIPGWLREGQQVREKK